VRDFRVIYNLLHVYKKLLHDNGDRYELTQAEAMGTTTEHVGKIFTLLCNAGLLSGSSIATASITLQGLEYLEENKKMQEVAREKNA